MLRISVTDLDGFLYWRESDQELDALIARLKGMEAPTPAMIAGRAFHKMFEESQEVTLDKIEVDGYEFTFAMDGEIPLPQIRELKGEYVFQTPVGPVTLVGKVDGLTGLTVRDYKLTERFDAEKYADSLQWRSYLMMFEANTFVYDVFVGKYDDSRITIHEYHTIKFHSYPGMREDVYREVCALAEIVDKHVPEKRKAA